MSNAARLPPAMSVAEFQEWTPPEEHRHRRWQLVGGEPICMAPTSVDHGMIQGEAAFLLRSRLRASGSACRVGITPGVIPRVASNLNELIPDLGVTCSPPAADKTMQEPVLLVEIISPSNRRVTERNILAYTTIPSVQEILSLDNLSISGKLYRRDASGDWENDPLLLEPSSDVVLQSIGFACRLSDFYATSSLAEHRGERGA